MIKTFKNLRKTLALVICLSMILGLLPSMMFTVAAGTLPEGAMSINGINFTKSLGKFLGPNQPDAIKLEAWVNGSVSLTENTPPTDIILVLDQSGSMDETIAGTSTTKLTAMRGAVRAFSDEIAAMNDINTERDDEYRVAIVGFASENSNTEILTAYNSVQTGTSGLDQDKDYYIFNGSNYEEIRYFDYSIWFPVGWYTVGFLGLKGDAVEDDAQIYESTSNNSFINCTTLEVSENGTIDNAIKTLDGNGATRADLGFELAKNIFSAQPEGTYGGADGRQKVIIFLTDGVPTTSNDFSPTVANDAIEYAKEMKDDNTRIFSLYLGALENTDAENFMQAVSSNYPEATSYTNLGTQAANSYCSAHTSATDISDVFVDIALTVQSLSMINETAVVADTISEYYTFPGQTLGGSFIEDQIEVYTVNWTGTDWEKDGENEVLNPFNYATVSIDDATKEVDITGFNFAYHCVTADPKNTAGTDFGRKLVVLIPVVLDPDAEHFGGYLPTNDGAGIYANADAEEPLVPEADEYNDATINYHLTATEKWYHIVSPDTTYTFNFTDPAVMNSILSEMIKDVPDGENNAGVKMQYFLYDTMGTPGDRSDDVPIAETEEISSGDTLDVTKIENWDVTVGNVTLEEGTKIYALQCKLQNTDKEEYTLDVYALLSLGVVAEDVHIVGGEIDEGGKIFVDIPGGVTPLFLDDNAYLERFTEGDPSRDMKFVLEEGYEFSKIRVDTNSHDGTHSSELIFDITDPEKNDTSIFGTTTFEKDTYIYPSVSEVENGYAVVVEPRLKRYNLTTIQDENSMITPYSPEGTYSYEYNSEDTLKVEFAARSGYAIKSITIDGVLYDSDIHTATLNTETYTKGSDDITVIVSGEIELSRTDNHEIIIESEKREYKLTCLQYVRQWTPEGYIYNEDADATVEEWLYFGDDLSTTVPVTAGETDEIDEATYYFTNWFTSKNGTVFSGIRIPAEMTMPANNLTLHGYWAMTPDQTIPGSPVNVKKVINVPSDDSDNNTFRIIATLNGAIVASEYVTVPAAATEVTAEIEPLLTDAQYYYYTNGTPIIIYEESDSSKPWFYDRTLYEVVDAETGYIVRVQGADFPAEGNIALFNNLSTEGFRVEYDLAGGKYLGENSVPPLTEVSWSQTNLLPPETPTKTNHTFAGWKMGTVTVTNEHPYGVLADNPEVRTITLVAQWTRNDSPGGGGGGGSTVRYTLTYDTNGGNDIPPETYAKDRMATLSKVPKKEGYIFDGWHKDKELTEDVKEIRMTGNITVYAAWVKDNGNAGNGHSTPGVLNGEEHFAYVVGYPDGTVRPNDNITRAEVTSIFFRLLKENVREENITSTSPFIDIDDDNWFNTAVATMNKLGVVKGRLTDSFVPNAFITRAEFAAICARFDDSEFEVADEFKDVAGHWAEDEIHEAAAHGWIRGYEDNTFKPNQFITRAEAMTMINRVLNRVPEDINDLLDDMIKWSDNSDTEAWYYIPVQEATNGHRYNIKNNIYEKWTALTDVTDWTKYQ